MHIHKKFHLTLIAAFTVFMAGCTTTGTQPTEQASESGQTTKKQNTSSTPKPVIQWSGLQEKLRQALQAFPEAEIGVNQEQDGLHLMIPVTRGFPSGKAEIRPSLAQVLNAIAPVLADESKVAIHIVGHTDSVGNEMYNQKLSILRAEAVMEYLRGRGIALERLSADGKGEAEPIADNAKESGRARNRRVEFFLLPLSNQ